MTPPIVRPRYPYEIRSKWSKHKKRGRARRQPQILRTNQVLLSSCPFALLCTRQTFFLHGSICPFQIRLCRISIAGRPLRSISSLVARVTMKLTTAPLLLLTVATASSAVLVHHPGAKERCGRLGVMYWDPDELPDDMGNLDVRRSPCRLP